MIDFSSEKLSRVVLLDTGTPGTSREIYGQDADDCPVGVLVYPVGVPVSSRTTVLLG